MLDLFQGHVEKRIRFLAARNMRISGGFSPNNCNGTPRKKICENFEISLWRYLFSLYRNSYLDVFNIMADCNKSFRRVLCKKKMLLEVHYKMVVCYVSVMPNIRDLDVLWLYMIVLCWTCCITRVHETTHFRCALSMPYKWFFTDIGSKWFFTEWKFRRESNNRGCFPRNYEKWTSNMNFCTQPQSTTNKSA